MLLIVKICLINKECLCHKMYQVNKISNIEIFCYNLVIKCTYYTYYLLNIQVFHGHSSGLQQPHYLHHHQQIGSYCELLYFVLCVIISSDHWNVRLLPFIWMYHVITDFLNTRRKCHWLCPVHIQDSKIEVLTTCSFPPNICVMT